MTSLTSHCALQSYRTLQGLYKDWIRLGSITLSCLGKKEQARGIRGCLAKLPLGSDLVQPVTVQGIISPWTKWYYSTMFKAAISKKTNKYLLQDWSYTIIINYSIEQVQLISHNLFSKIFQLHDVLGSKIKIGLRSIAPFSPLKMGGFRTSARNRREKNQGYNMIQGQNSSGFFGHGT